MSSQLFDWPGYFRLAQELGKRAEESCLRSCLSRAYYYVYSIALIRASKNGFSFAPGEATHRQLWRVYSESPDPDCSRLGQIAMRLKVKREKADYGPVYSRLEEEVQQVLSDAEDFAARLERLAPRLPNPTSIRR